MDSNDNFKLQYQILEYALLLFESFNNCEYMGELFYNFNNFIFNCLNNSILKNDQVMEIQCLTFLSNVLFNSKLQKDNEMKNIILKIIYEDNN